MEACTERQERNLQERKVVGSLRCMMKRKDSENGSKKRKHFRLAQYTPRERERDWRWRT